jgi:hypothetical protein
MHGLPGGTAFDDRRILSVGRSASTARLGHQGPGVALASVSREGCARSRSRYLGGGAFYERASMEVGDRVEVHTRFNNSWVRGFEIASVVGSGYRLCRISDGTVLPSVTSDSDLRPEGPDRSV